MVELGEQGVLDDRTGGEGVSIHGSGNRFSQTGGTAQMKATTATTATTRIGNTSEGGGRN